jgi:hypothetical protein
VQGPLPADSPPTSPELRPLAANEVARLDSKLAEIADPELRAALGRLGKVLIGQH